MGRLIRVLFLLLGLALLVVLATQIDLMKVKTLFGGYGVGFPTDFPPIYCGLLL